MPPDFDKFYRGPNPNNITWRGGFDLNDIGDGSKEYHGILRELARRAADSQRSVILGLWGPHDPGEPLLEVTFPAGETVREVCIDHTNCKIFQDIPFGEYQFLTQYDAIWSKHSDSVEASVDYTGYPLDSDHTVTDPPSGAELHLGLPSKAAQGLLSRSASAMTLVLAGAHIRSVDEANAALENIGTAFLFQAGLADGYLYSLVKVPSVADRSEPYVRSRATYRWTKDLSFPQRKIEPEPLALYYYAGTLNANFPLLKFLAYYQVLEYFFVRYSWLDVAGSVTSALLQSGFDTHDAGLVEKIVNQALVEAGGRGFGPERDQLLATVTHCVDVENLRNLLTEYHHDGITLGNHLADRRRLARVTPVKNHPSGKDSALLRSLSDRIYDIRNRIVHAKQNATDRGPEPLFPFSRESMALQPDIEVLRYVAASVLIESAISIR